MVVQGSELRSEGEKTEGVGREGRKRGQAKRWKRNSRYRRCCQDSDAWCHAGRLQVQSTS